MVPQTEQTENSAFRKFGTEHPLSTTAQYAIIFDGVTSTNFNDLF